MLYLGLLLYPSGSVSYHGDVAGSPLWGCPPLAIALHSVLMNNTTLVTPPLTPPRCAARFCLTRVSASAHTHTHCQWSIDVMVCLTSSVSQNPLGAGQPCNGAFSCCWGLFSVVDESTFSARTLGSNTHTVMWVCVLLNAW